MNRINLKESDLPTGRPAFSGTESKLYRTYDNKLFKLFNYGMASKEKYKKLELLSEMDLKENIFRDLVFVNDEFVGYTMDNLEYEGYKQIDGHDELFWDKRISVAKKIWKRLEDFHKLGITYGDVHNYNILYNGKDIIFCDMDSIMIGDYSLDKIGEIHKEYLYKTKFKFELIDNFMFNLFFIGYYQDIYMPRVYRNLMNRNLQKRVKNDACMKIAHDMTNLNADYDGELFIDHLNDNLTSKLKRTLSKR